ncbi:unnamed protein product [Haemonchus placei]|uniref:Transcription elongation factor n=1 Tax=Haemonchus placei TaxID=6290 RepID=A0A0N4W9V1_HAEPC|nr:unnamed protein product [Haemonchus placei]
MPSCEDEVLAIGRKLDKIIDGTKPGDNAADLLEVLSKLPITIDVLTKTRIGMTINDLRKKTTDEKLAKKAKSLIKEWKNLVDKREDKKEKAAKNEPSSSNSGKNNGSVSDQPTPKIAQPSTQPPAPIPGHHYSSNFPPKHLEADEVRLKSAQMILNALRYAELPVGTLDPEEIAVKVEEKLFSVHKGTGDKYKAALRSRVFNLRDKKNPALRENVLTGVVKPEKFAVMTSEEMASDEVREMRDKFNKAAILEHQMSVQQGTPSDMFKCGKCGKKNCTYTQLQTRSSDEPMTTFVFCLECGNRWKFC